MPASTLSPSVAIKQKIIISRPRRRDWAGLLFIDHFRTTRRMQTELITRTDQTNCTQNKYNAAPRKIEDRGGMRLLSCHDERLPTGGGIMIVKIMSAHRRDLEIPARHGTISHRSFRCRRPDSLATACRGS